MKYMFLMLMSFSCSNIQAAAPAKRSDEEKTWFERNKDHFAELENRQRSMSYGGGDTPADIKRILLENSALTGAMIMNMHQQVILQIDSVECRLKFLERKVDKLEAHASGLPSKPSSAR